MPGVGAGRLAAEPQGLHVPAQGGAPEAGAAFLPLVPIVVARQLSVPAWDVERFSARVALLKNRKPSRNCSCCTEA